MAAIREPLDLLALDVPGSAVDKIVELSVGYPYLIQFFAKEMVDAVLHAGAGALEGFPSEAVWRRLDSGIFAARWGRTTDKQREALKVMARLPAETAEFTPHDVADGSAEFGIGAMTNAQAGQIMQGLVERGLIYRTRRGKYAFALPMSRVMILRRMLDDDDQGLPGFADLSAPAEIVAHQPASDELEIEERPGPAIYASGAAVDDSEPAPMSDELVAAFREVMRTVPVRPQREVLRGSPRADASAMAAPAASSFWSFRGMRS
ncbi:MAG TPA: hypothetical protein PK264_15160 [Hyphomicrobiaceae bacterium]|nr:hypothetical protein [Hyphomicrobiaceae bacterium]